MVKQCSQEEKQESAKLFAGKGQRFGPAWVEVIEADQASRTVRFWAPGEGRRVEVKCEWTEDHVLARCPSTLDATPERLPVAGAQGTLYLSSALVAANDLQVSIKWPDAYAAAADYRPLRVWPIEILVRGTELETGNQFTSTIDALDPDLVEPDGTLRLHRDRPLTLNVSPRGASRFVVRWSALPDPAELRRAIEVARDDQAAAAAKAEAWTQIASAEALVALSEPEDLPLGLAETSRGPAAAAEPGDDARRDALRELLATLRAPTR